MMIPVMVPVTMKVTVPVAIVVTAPIPTVLIVVRRTVVSRVVARRVGEWFNDRNSGHRNSHTDVWMRLSGNALSDASDPKSGT
jgi:hypothetical protein